jgi:aminomethyltransferase
LGVRREDVMLNGHRIGMLTNCVWSYRMKANIGFVLVDSAVPVGTEVKVARMQGPAQGRLVEIPFL